jgi:dihydroorotate dehydrogenase
MLITSGKREAIIDPAWMNTAGALGFSDETGSNVDLGRLGAFVTHPISYAPRRTTQETRLHDYPGGFLLHTGLPNPGLTAVLRRHHRRWRRMPVPVIVHLIVDDPGELRLMLLQLEREDSVSAVELGLDAEDPDLIRRQLSPVASSELPIIARLNASAGWPAIEAAYAAGAAAIGLAPPRGAVGGSQRPSSGRAMGPGLFPIMLERTSAIAAALDKPLVVSGGIRNAADVGSLIHSGAGAVQLDFALWTNPGILESNSPQQA